MNEIAAAVAGVIVGWLLDQPWKRRERIAKETAEAELLLIRRRADAPFLAPSPRLFQQVFEDHGEKGVMGVWHVGNGNLLCHMRQEVDQKMPEGGLVILVIENKGKSCQRVSIKLDGAPIPLVKEPDMSGSHGLYFLKYPFISQLRGKEQIVEVCFECSGFQDTHRYLTKHGFRVLQRIDPV